MYPAFESDGLIPAGGRTLFTASSGLAITKGPYSLPETCRVKRLQFFRLAQVKTLSDINEGRHRGILWPERAGNDRADMRRGDSLWRA